MATVQVYQYCVMNVDDRVVKAGSLTEARCVTLSSDEVADQTFSVAASTAVKIFDKSENEALGGFSFLWLESDLDVLVQTTTDAGATDAYDVKELKGSGMAGTMGPALVLGSDDTLKLDGAIDAFTGTADTIDEIWVYNQSTTDAARVRIIVAV